MSMTDAETLLYGEPVTEDDCSCDVHGCRLGYYHGEGWVCPACKEEANMEPSMLPECKHCGGIGSWYGVGPHRHDFGKTGSVIGSTVIDDKADWPKNFHEDHEAPGCGVWTCTKCRGTGRQE